MVLTDTFTTAMAAFILSTTLITARFSKLECERHLFRMIVAEPLAGLLFSFLIWFFKIKAAQYEYYQLVFGTFAVSQTCALGYDPF